MTSPDASCKATLRLALLLSSLCSVHAVPSADEDRFALLQTVGWSNAVTRTSRKHKLEAQGPESDVLPREGAAERLSRALPLAWTHVPKSGSSFANSLIHLPGVCEGLPRDLEISERAYGTYHLGAADAEWNFVAGPCRKGLLKWGSHEGVEMRGWDEYNGHGFIMLRQPEQRLISAYTDGQHSWPYENLTAENISRYAEVVQGCVTRMLTRRGTAHGSNGNHWGGPCGGPEKPSLDDVKMAVRRLNGYAFVGIVEAWPLSICLLHAKFGGSCQSPEFVNSRHQLSTPPEAYKTEDLLGNWTDPYDSAVYEEGMRIFKADLERYGISEETCKPCFYQGVPWLNPAFDWSKVQVA